MQSLNSYDNYDLNVDPNPIVIRKKPSQAVTQTQNISLKFLKPPPPPPAGDILIVQEPDRQEPAQPPLVIRKQAPKPADPAPLIIREKPPNPPAPIPEQVITIPGKVIQQPRRVIVEKFAPKPPKPPSIIIERWLAYPKQTREVVVESKPPPIYLDSIDYNQINGRQPQIINETVMHDSIKTLPLCLDNTYEPYAY